MIRKLLLFVAALAAFALGVWADEAVDVQTEEPETVTQTVRSTGPLGAPPPTRISVVVRRVYDGDTFSARFPDGRVRSIRLIGVDTPETLRVGTPVQCHGPSASAYAKRRLTKDERVTLVPDTQVDADGFDRYGRVLSYVYADRRFFQSDLVRLGHAKYYPYNNSMGRLYPRLEADERFAREKKRGLWGPPCNGDTKKPQP